MRTFAFILTVTERQRRVKLGQAEVAVLNQIYILENHSGYSVETS